MMPRKIGGGMGTNQYQARDKVRNKAPAVNWVGVALVDSDSRRRCGEVWGTKCKAWVVPPKYTHDNHPTLTCKIETAEDLDIPVKLPISCYAKGMVGCN